MATAPLAEVFSHHPKIERLKMENRELGYDDDAGALDFRFKHRQKLGTGTFELLVEAVDVAGNSTFDRLTYTVTSPSEVAALAAP